MARMVVDAELLADQMSYSFACSEWRRIPQLLWPGQQTFDEGLFIRFAQLRLSTGTTRGFQHLGAADGNFVSPAAHRLVRNFQAAANLAVVQIPGEQIQSLQPAFLQSFEVAAYTPWVSHIDETPPHLESSAILCEAQ